MASSKNDSKVDDGYPDKFETVSMKKWSESDAGEKANGGFTGSGHEPYGQPSAYRDLWAGPNQEDA